MLKHYKFYALAFFLSLPLLGKASHIVGGEITYECLGNDMYKISLEIYRDCYFGNPLAYFDDPAHIGVFDQNNMLVMVVDMPFTGMDDTLSAIFNDPCLFDPGDVCVHTTHYEKIVTLPTVPGGYQLVYQRCCRNQTISNITNPDESGMTLLTYISEESMLQCNSGPDFTFIPPIFICVNKPIVFDHSAVDAEGDSLVYRLCTPYVGATSSDPYPDVPSNPPYDTVVWVDPPYNLDNVLGTDSTVLTIDPQTGLLTGFPTNQGQFVVSICVEEYRNGQLLSSMRRDFQYNVGVCGEVTSSFFVPDAQCDNLTVNFDNQSSVYASEYLWYFQYPDTTASSTLENPTYTYPDTGTYTIMLIADPNSVCADTFFRDIYLQYNSLFAEYDLQVFDCSDSSVVSLFDHSYDTISAPVAWHWTLTYDTITLTSNEQNPNFYVPNPSSGTVTMQVLSQNGCEQSLTLPWEAGQDFPGQVIPDTAYACEGQLAYLNPNADDIVASSYLWQPGAPLSDSTAANPSVQADSVMHFTVYIQSPANFCEFSKEVTVVPLPYPDLTTPDSILLCYGESVVLNPGGNPNYHYSWFSSGAPLSDPEAVSPEVSPEETTIYTVEITAPGPDTCVTTRQVLVHVPPPIGLQPFSDMVTCDSALTLTAQTVEFTTVFWFENGQPILPPSDQITVEVSGENEYMLNAVDVYGCVAADTFTVAGGPVDVEVTPAAVEACTGEPIQIQATNLDPNDQLSYSWEVIGSGSLSANDIPNPVFTGSQAGTTLVVGTFTSQYNCSTQDTVEITLVSGNAQLAFTYEILCDGLSVQFINQSVNVDSFFWDFGVPGTDTDTSTLENPVFTFPDLGSYNVTLSIPYAVSCGFPVSIQVDITDPILQADFSYDYASCAEDSIAISFTNETVSTLTGQTIDSLQWTFSNGQTSTEANPVIWAYPGDSPLIAMLEVFTSGGCMDDKADTLLLNFTEVFLPDTVVLCFGDTTQLNPGANPDYEYLWTPATGLSDPTSGSPLAFPTETTTYTLHVTNNQGADTCQLEQTVTVFVPEDIQLDILPGDSLITCGPPVLLEAQVNVDVDYQWTNGGGVIIGSDSSITVLPDSTDTYILEVSDQYNCTDTAQTVVTNGTIDVQTDNELFVCPADSILLSILNLDSFDSLSVVWTAGPGGTILSDSTALEVWVSTSTGTVSFSYVLQNQFGCEETGEVLVHTSDFTAAVQDTVEACAGVPVELNPDGNPAYDYLWIPGTGLDDSTSYNPTAILYEDQLYTVIISNDDGFAFCSDTQYVYVHIYPLIELEAYAEPDTVLCDTDTAMLFATASVPVSLTWHEGSVDGPIVGTGSPITVAPEGTLTYYVIATDSFACMDTAEVSLYHYPLQVSLAPEYNFCDYDDFWVQVINGDPDQELTYLWSPDSVLLPPLDSSAVYVDADGDVQLSVLVTNQYGCDTTLYTQVHFIHVGLGLFAEAEPDTILLGSGETSQLTTVDLPGYQYDWMPPFTLSDPTIYNPVASPEETTTYTVSVVEPVAGCTAEAEVTVYVITPECAEPVIFVPSAFTPNGDGNNDVLYVYGNDQSDLFFDEFYFVIYDRWGQKLFETTDPKQGWDGSYKGKELPPDVYGFYLKVKCYNQQTFTKKGNVSLLR